jgi:leucyl-tRNA synthetase
VKHSIEFYVLLNTVCTDVARVKLLRYEDPVMGPRRMPVFEHPENGKVVLDSNATLVADINGKKVTVTEGKSTVDVGSQLVYVVA